jgi:hypothetical protein
MMELSFLNVFTAIVDFFFLTLSLWLGFFIVTRGNQTRVSWLAGATLWSLTGSFLINLIQLFSSTHDDMAWWWGWSIAIAASFLYHLSLSLLPRELAIKRNWLNSLIYIVALNLIAIETYTPLIFVREVNQGVGKGSVPQTGPLFPLFAGFLIIIPLLVLDNLRLGLSRTKTVPGQQRFKVLIWAGMFVLWGTIFGVLRTWLAPEISSVFSDLCFGGSVLLLGYGVARWNALIEGHSVKLDFLYTSLAFSLVVGVYLTAAWFSNMLFDVPLVAYMLVIILAIVSHSVYDWVRSYLDHRIFGSRSYRDLRENLREFSRLVHSGQELKERLGVLLQVLCNTLDVSRGFIALREGDGFIKIAEVGAIGDFGSMNLKAFDVDEITQISSLKDRPDTYTNGLIVPLHFGGHQIGVVVIGERAAGPSYSDVDLHLLEDLADIVAAVIQTAKLQEKSVEQIGSLLGEIRHQDQQILAKMKEAMGEEDDVMRVLAESDQEAIALVEDALRHLHDFSYLGHQSLAKLLIVTSYLDVGEKEPVTHVDMGKALKETLLVAINKLMPSADRGPVPPSREWHPHIILHDCYLLGKLNRDVMSDLYISEGTFNRTRRRALRGMTRTLAEMEMAVLMNALGKSSSS